MDILTASLLLLCLLTFVLLFFKMAYSFSSSEEPAERKKANAPQKSTMYDRTHVPGLKAVALDVNGVQYRNSNGSNRQSIIKRLKVLDNLKLLRDEGNEHDVNAVSVVSDHGQIGYISRKESFDVSNMLIAEVIKDCFVYELPTYDEVSGVKLCMMVDNETWQKVKVDKPQKPPIREIVVKGA